MTDVLNIKPAPGRTVRDPNTMKLLAEDGENKPRTGFWLRRLKDGDVIYAEQEGVDGEPTQPGDVNAAVEQPANTTAAKTSKGAK